MPERSDLHDALERFRSAPVRSEFDAALVVTEFLGGAAAVADARSRWSALLARCRSALSGRHCDAQGICECLRADGFRGAEADYYSLDHSRLDRVLHARRGIPITLAIVHLQLARSLGLEAAGINFPGHFLARIGQELIDPHLGQVVTEQMCVDRYAASASGASRPALFRIASPEDVMLRMLNNVKGLLMQAGAFERTLQVVELQLHLRRGDPTLQLESAALWERLGADEQALAVLYAARVQLTDPRVAAEIDAWMARLRTRIRPRLH